MAEKAVLRFGRTAEAWIVRVENQGTLQESPAMRQFALDILEQHGGQLIIDLCDCAYVDSTFLGCMVMLHKHATSEEGAGLTVAIPADARATLLGNTRLDQLLQLAETAPSPDGDWVELTGPQLTSQQLGKHIADCHRRLADYGGDQSDAFLRVADAIERDIENSSS